MLGAIMGGWQDHDAQRFKHIVVLRGFPRARARAWDYRRKQLWSSGSSAVRSGAAIGVEAPSGA